MMESILPSWVRQARSGLLDEPGSPPTRTMAMQVMEAKQVQAGQE